MDHPLVCTIRAGGGEKRGKGVRAVGIRGVRRSPFAVRCSEFGVRDSGVLDLQL